MVDWNVLTVYMSSSFTLGRGGLKFSRRDRSPDSRRLQQRLRLPIPPSGTVAFHRLQRSLTVAGQWRFFTALPVHLAGKLWSSLLFLSTRIRYPFGPKSPAETDA